MLKREKFRKRGKPMDLFVWIFVSLFASMGVAQAVGWLICTRRNKRLRRGYHIIPLYNDVETLEAQLRYELSQVRWGYGGNGLLLLVDMGLENEAARLCDRLLKDVQCAFICKCDELPETIKRLDNLQIPLT